jgi:hypothetical protein
MPEGRNHVSHLSDVFNHHAEVLGRAVALRKETVPVGPDVIVTVIRVRDRLCHEVLVSGDFRVALNDVLPGFLR